MKILNLFAGLGGNRLAFGKGHEVTAVEYNSQIAFVYSKRFPNDNVIVADAFQYFLDHFHEFDLIWASPPCQTHSSFNGFAVNAKYSGSRQTTCKLPDARLWSLIQFCKTWVKATWIIENVQMYYDPWIRPTCKLGRHFIWSNKYIPDLPKTSAIFGKKIKNAQIDEKLNLLCDLHHINRKLIDNLSNINKVQLLNNCVRPDEARYVFKWVTKRAEQFDMNEFIEI